MENAAESCDDVTLRLPRRGQLPDAAVHPLLVASRDLGLFTSRAEAANATDMADDLASASVLPLSQPSFGDGSDKSDTTDSQGRDENGGCPPPLSKTLTVTQQRWLAWKSIGLGSVVRWQWKSKALLVRLLKAHQTCRPPCAAPADGNDDAAHEDVSSSLDEVSALYVPATAEEADDAIEAFLQDDSQFVHLATSGAAPCGERTQLLLRHIVASSAAVARRRRSSKTSESLVVTAAAAEGTVADIGTPSFGGSKWSVSRVRYLALCVLGLHGSTTLQWLNQDMVSNTLRRHGLVHFGKTRAGGRTTVKTSLEVPDTPQARAELDALQCAIQQDFLNCCGCTCVTETVLPEPATADVVQEHIVGTSSQAAPAKTSVAAEETETTSTSTLDSSPQRRAAEETTVVAAKTAEKTDESVAPIVVEPLEERQRQEPHEEPPRPAQQLLSEAVVEQDVAAQEKQETEQPEKKKDAAKEETKEVVASEKEEKPQPPPSTVEGGEQEEKQEAVARVVRTVSPTTTTTKEVAEPAKEPTKKSKAVFKPLVAREDSVEEDRSAPLSERQTFATPLVLARGLETKEEEPEAPLTTVQSSEAKAIEEDSLPKQRASLWKQAPVEDDGSRQGTPLDVTKTTGASQVAVVDTLPETKGATVSEIAPFVDDQGKGTPFDLTKSTGTPQTFATVVTKGTPFDLTKSTQIPQTIVTETLPQGQQGVLGQFDDNKARGTSFGIIPPDAGRTAEVVSLPKEKGTLWKTAPVSDDDKRKGTPFDVTSETGTPQTLSTETPPQQQTTGLESPPGEGDERIREGFLTLTPGARPSSLTVGEPLPPAQAKCSEEELERLQAELLNLTKERDRLYAMTTGDVAGLVSVPATEEKLVVERKKQRAVAVQAVVVGETTPEEKTTATDDEGKSSTIALTADVDTGRRALLVTSDTKPLGTTVDDQARRTAAVRTTVETKQPAVAAAGEVVPPTDRPTADGGEAATSATLTLASGTSDVGADVVPDTKPAAEPESEETKAFVDTLAKSPGRFRKAEPATAPTIADTLPEAVVEKRAETEPVDTGTTTTATGETSDTTAAVVPATLTVLPERPKHKAVVVTVVEETPQPPPQEKTTERAQATVLATTECTDEQLVALQETLRRLRDERDQLETEWNQLLVVRGKDEPKAEEPKAEEQHRALVSDDQTPRKTVVDVEIVPSARVEAVEHLPAAIADSGEVKPEAVAPVPAAPAVTALAAPATEEVVVAPLPERRIAETKEGGRELQEPEPRTSLVVAAPSLAAVAVPPAIRPQMTEPARVTAATLPAADPCWDELARLQRELAQLEREQQALQHALYTAPAALPAVAVDAATHVVVGPEPQGPAPPMSSSVSELTEKPEVPTAVSPAALRSPAPSPRRLPRDAMAPAGAEPVQRVTPVPVVPAVASAALRTDVDRCETELDGLRHAVEQLEKELAALEASSSSLKPSTTVTVADTAPSDAVSRPFSLPPSPRDALVRGASDSESEDASSSVSSTTTDAEGAELDALERQVRDCEEEKARLEKEWQDLQQRAAQFSLGGGNASAVSVV